MTDTSDEDGLLPPGWRKKESSSNPGKFYYISPNGQTQWVRPGGAPAVPRVYNWAVEITIEFGAGRLGVGLREVRQENDLLYPEFQAEVEDLPKLPNGKAGPAEIYNWSVKPDQRLRPGMRVTTIAGTPLAGYTYTEVVERLKKAQRPMKICFVDVEKGSKADQEARSESTAKNIEQEGSAFSKQKKLLSEYQELLVHKELRNETLATVNTKLLQKNHDLRIRLKLIGDHYQALKSEYSSLNKENKKLEKAKTEYSSMKQQLKQQEKGLVESSEAIRMKKLAKINATLMQDIENLSEGNKKLKKKRDQLQVTLDRLDVHHDGDGDISEFGEFDNDQSLEAQLQHAKAELRQLEDELLQEEDRTSSAQREVERLTQQYNHLQKSEKRQEEIVTGEKSPAVVALENKIDELREKLHEAVTAMAHAAKNGDKKLTEECARQRVHWKKELKIAQDELRSLKECEEIEGRGGRSSSVVREKSPSRRMDNRSVPQNGRPPMSNSSSSNELPTMTGILFKCPTITSDQSGLMRNVKSMRRAKERWCSLDGLGNLLYFKRKGDTQPRGKISFFEENMDIASELPNSPSFVISTSSQQIRFVANSPEDLNNWLRALQQTRSLLLPVIAQRKQSVASNNSSRSKDHRGRSHSRARHPSSSPQSNSSAMLDPSDHGRATLGFT